LGEGLTPLTFRLRGLGHVLVIFFGEGVYRWREYEERSLSQGLKILRGRSLCVRGGHQMRSRKWGVNSFCLVSEKGVLCYDVGSLNYKTLPPCVRRGLTLKPFNGSRVGEGTFCMAPRVHPRGGGAGGAPFTLPNFRIDEPHLPNLCLKGPRGW